MNGFVIAHVALQKKRKRKLKMTKQGTKPKMQYPACYVPYETKRGYCSVCFINWKCTNKRDPDDPIKRLKKEIKRLEGQLLEIKNDPSIGKLIVEVSEDKEMED